MDIHKLVSIAQATEQQITIETTVVTGFEEVVQEACVEQFGQDLVICIAPGRVFFNINIRDVEKVRELRGIDNIFLIISSFANFGISNVTLLDGEENDQLNTEKKENKLKDIEIIKRNALNINWKKYMDVWKKITNYEGALYPTLEQFEKYNTVLREQKNTRHSNTNIIGPNNEPKKDKIEEIEDKWSKLEESNNNSEDLLKFRVTCHRVGKHSFSSGESERAFGGTLNDAYLWLVDLDNYDIDINLNLRDNEAYVALSVTKKSLHRRNIVEFNLTTLKSTIAFNMVRLAAPSPGEIFLDPMCGGGTIPIESSLAYPHTFFLSGDINEKLVNKTRANLAHNSTNAERELKVSPLVCNVRSLCLRSSCVDGVVTDLPFGKRVGSKSNNYLLYRQLLVELGRVVRPAGRAVLLTSDRKHLFQALHVTNTLWKSGRHFKINMSGIKSFVFMLSRTAELFDYALHGLKEKHKGKPFGPRKL